jgi:predicted DsbA family dithiol-disulfide isomerase
MPASSADELLSGDIGVPGVPAFYINGHLLFSDEEAPLRAGLGTELERARRAHAQGVPGAQLYARLTRDGVTTRPRVHLAPLDIDRALARTRGSQRADAVEIHEFCDYEKPRCALYEQTLRHLFGEHRDRLRWVWWDLVSPERFAARRAAVAARAGGDYWRMHDALFDDLLAMPFDHRPPDALAPERLRQIAERAGADLPAYDYQLAQGQLDSDVERAYRAARDLGIDRPLIIIDGEGYRGSEPVAVLQHAVERALAGK